MTRLYKRKGEEGRKRYTKVEKRTTKQRGEEYRRRKREKCERKRIYKVIKGRKQKRKEENGTGRNRKFRKARR